MGIAALGTGEFIREAVRKPYIIYNVVLGQSDFAAEVPDSARAAISKAAFGPGPT